MSKKPISLILAVIIAVSLCSCSLLKNAPETSDTSRNTVPPTESVSQTDPADEPPTDTETASATSAATTHIAPVIPTPEPGAPKTVLIDAGHGYIDPGCTTEYLGGKYERDIVAEAAEQLRLVLESEGYRTVMLRDDSKYITASEIAAAADRIGLSYLPDKLVDDQRFAAYNRTVWANVLLREQYIDMFISLHIDVYEASEDVRGTRIYYCSENDYSSLSEKLSSAITARLAGALPDMNPRYFAKGWNDAFVVTKRTDMPSILIEMGFASNKDDAANLLDPEWRETFVSAVADGIGDYLGTGD